MYNMPAVSRRTEENKSSGLTRGAPVQVDGRRVHHRCVQLPIICGHVTCSRCSFDISRCPVFPPTDGDRWTSSAVVPMADALTTICHSASGAALLVAESVPPATVDAVMLIWRAALARETIEPGSAAGAPRPSARACWHALWHAHMPMNAMI